MRSAARLTDRMRLSTSITIRPSTIVSRSARSSASSDLSLAVNASFPARTADSVLRESEVPQQRRLDPATTGGRGGLQWEISTGRVIVRMIERVTPPKIHSRVREWP